MQVRFLYDYLGSKHWDKTKLEALVPLGAKVAKDVVSISHLNYRDHRKIVVIDGEIGYTGGYNVGQEYVDGGERFAVWRDTHVRVTGQIVGELEALFAARWFDQTKEDVCTDEYLPAPPAAGSDEAGILCQVIAQSVEDPWKSSRRAHMLAVGNAARRVWIQSPYFIPEVGLYDTMINAALSGVDVRFMMTGVPDKKVPFWAAWTYFRPLLKAGVKVYLYEAGFLHSKTLTADGQITAIGTMNMDIRSLRLHKELMLWMYDEKLAVPAGAAVRGGHRQLARDHAHRPRRPQPDDALPQLVHAAAVVLHLKKRQRADASARSVENHDQIGTAIAKACAGWRAIDPSVELVCWSPRGSVLAGRRGAPVGRRSEGGHALGLRRRHALRLAVVAIVRRGACRLRRPAAGVPRR